MEGATRRAHLIGTTSGSESTSHAILPIWLIVVEFPPKLLRRIGIVRFIYLQKHLGTILPSLFLTDIAASAWDRPRRGHIRQTTIHQLWRSAQAAPDTTFGDRRRLLLHGIENENRSHEPKTWPTTWQRNINFENSVEHTMALWKTPLRQDGKILKVEDKVQGTATPAADPAASLMNQRSKSNDKPEPWHTPSRWGDELQNLEEELQGAVIPVADPTDLPMDQSHIIHSTSMSEDKLRLSLEHYPMLKTLHANSNMESWSRPRRRKNIKVDFDTIHKAKISASSQSIQKIVACKMNTP